jgi:methylated-DNA-[protein]-cysteine S-methyltransferase
MDTPTGRLKLVSDGKAIIEVKFIKGQTLTDEPAEIRPEERPKCLQQCVSQLNEYFLGNRSVFDLPLYPGGTEFQLRVWKELCRIPYGTTISYMDLAKRLGDPKLIRAAGSANGKNPVAIIIPCHRVIGADGSLVGYAGGLPLKKWLINHEQRYYSGVIQGTIF